MLQTNEILDHSIANAFVMEHIGYLIAAGGLSYNIPELFKIKSESGYMLRAGIMSAASLAMIPAVLLLPDSYPVILESFAWFVCFVGGLFFAGFGARKLQAKLSGFLSKFTIKNSIRKGSKTDIRQMKHVLPRIENYNPLKYIDLKKGIFIGLDENVKPIYLKDFDDWYKKNLLIVGSTRTGKGVAMGYLGVQSLRLGETVIFLDPKGDKFMPHIYKAECEKLGVPYHYVDITQDVPQINLIAEFDSRDLKNCLVEAFSQREMGAESDVYRKNEQEFLENFANFIGEQNQDANNSNADSRCAKSLLEVCKDYDVERYSDKYKSSVSDLNKLCNIKSINAANGKSLSELFAGGGCIYVVGDLLDETMKKIQRFIFCRFVQLARNRANYIDQHGGEEINTTVFADEFVAHVSRFVAESYTVCLGWQLKIVSAIQDLKLLKGAPADIDPDFLIGAVFGNSQNKLFYRADDIATADFLSDMTGRIQIEEEQKVVTRNSLNSEKLDRQTKLTQSERNYFDRNMILNLKQFEAIFCASLSYRDTIACLCKTSPVPVAKGVNGKQIINADDKNLAHQVHNEFHTEPHDLDDNQPTNNTTITNIESDGENYANNQHTEHSASNRDNQDQESSTSKSDYLF